MILDPKVVELFNTFFGLSPLFGHFFHDPGSLWFLLRFQQLGYEMISSHLVLFKYEKKFCLTSAWSAWQALFEIFVANFWNFWANRRNHWVLWYEKFFFSKVIYFGPWARIWSFFIFFINIRRCSGNLAFFWPNKGF